MNFGIDRSRVSCGLVMRTDEVMGLAGLASRKVSAA
jgi:hypothetical protein